MGINKVNYGNTTLIDLTSDTVTADKLAQGYTAHDNTGAAITGTMSGASIDVLTQAGDDSTNIHFSGVKGEPKAFFLYMASPTSLARSTNSTNYYVVCIRYDGTNTHGKYWRMSNGTIYSDSTHYSFTYYLQDGETPTLAVSSSSTSNGKFRSGGNYELTYIY